MSIRGVFDDPRRDFGRVALVGPTGLIRRTRGTDPG